MTENGLLATLSGKGLPRDHFPGFQHTVFSLERLFHAFGPLWAILGHFEGVGPKSAKAWRFFFLFLSLSFFPKIQKSADFLCPQKKVKIQKFSADFFWPNLVEIQKIFIYFLIFKFGCPKVGRFLKLAFSKRKIVFKMA